MPSRAVLLLALGLAASTLLGAEATGATAAEGTAAGAAPPAKSGSKPSTGDPGRTRPPRKDPDQELIEHLDEIERLELLQNLELFDTAAPARK